MTRKIFFSDLLAGLSVSFAALALGAAFGVMSGRGAFAGMIAAGVIPIMTGLFGGTRLGISGPTGPMTAVSSLVIAFAYDRFPDKVLAEQFVTVVFLLTGVFLIICGLLRLGKFINKVPQVVILGFMSGIALLIWVDQVKVLFGLDGKQAPAGDLVTTILVATATFMLILFLPRILRMFKVPRSVMTFIPSTLTGIVVMTLLTTLFMPGLGKIELGVTLESFSDFVDHLAAYFPTWSIFTTENLMLALPYALQLTLLGYLDSLLTALIMDHLTKEPSSKNKELVGQGIANSASAVFQGIPGAQATIRSVLLFKEGGKTRFGVVIAGLFVLLGFLAFKDSVTLITSAVFIGVLFKAGLDVFEKDFIETYIQRKWYYSRKRNLQLGFIIYTMLLTALVDLNVAVISGTILVFIANKKFGFNDIEVDFINEDDGLLAQERTGREDQAEHVASSKKPDKVLD